MAIKHVLKVEILYAQARRIDCEFCGKPYTFVDGGFKTGKTEQSVAFSNEDEMRREAFREAATEVENLAENRERGRGRCPHCHQLQSWMFVSKGSAIVGLGVAAIVAAAIVGFLLHLWVSTDVGVTAGLIVGVLGLIGAVVAGPKLADQPGPQPEEKDDKVKTDDQLLSHLQDCRARGVEPFLQWWKTVDAPRTDGSLPFSMGLSDYGSEQLEIDAALSTKSRCAELNRMDL